MEQRLIDANAQHKFCPMQQGKGIGPYLANLPDNVVVSISKPIDVVAVVRCAECKRFKQHPTDSRYFICDDSPFNTEYSPFVKPTDFCSYGERRDSRV